MIKKNKFAKNLTNIRLDDMFTTGLRENKELNEKTFSAVDEVLLQTRNTILQYIIAIFLESKLVDKKEQSRLEKFYDFNYEDIMKEFDSYFNI